MKEWLARKRLGIEIFPGLQSSFDHANSLFRPRITLQGCVGSLSTDATHGASIERPSLRLLPVGTRDGKGVHHGPPDRSFQKFNGYA